MYLTLQQKLHYTLRAAVAMCFIGHGAFGIITKPVWLNYFAVFGIGRNLAYQLMPVLGVVDILMGISMLVRPMRAVALWLVIWGLITAALRPLSGEPFAELIERAGNFGAPLALLILSGPLKRNLGSWFAGIDPAVKIDDHTEALLTNCLQLVVFLLLTGHGWLNLLEKKGLIGQYHSLGINNPALAAHLIGIFELLAALSIIIRPVKPVLLVLIIWKMATELFYPHYELFEWIERGGSYCTLLALYFLTGKQAIIKRQQNQVAVS